MKNVGKVDRIMLKRAEPVEVLPFVVGGTFSENLLSALLTLKQCDELFEQGNIFVFKLSKGNTCLV